MALSAAAAPSRPGTLTPTRLGASHAPPTRRRCGWCACSGTTLLIAAHISRSYHDHFPSSKWSHNLLQVRAAAVHPRAALTLLLGDALLASRQPGGALADAAESEAARCERRPGAASQAVRHCFSNPVARPQRSRLAHAPPVTLPTPQAHWVLPDLRRVAEGVQYIYAARVLPLHRLALVDGRHFGRPHPARRLLRDAARAPCRHGRRAHRAHGLDRPRQRRPCAHHPCHPHRPRQAR